MTDNSKSTVILDPTAERNPIGRHPAHRAEILTGTIGLIDISKPRGDVFLNELEHLISTRYPDIQVLRFNKPTFTKPAPEDLRAEVAEQCEAVIQALAD